MGRERSVPLDPGKPDKRGKIDSLKRPGLAADTSKKQAASCQSSGFRGPCFAIPAFDAKKPQIDHLLLTMATAAMHPDCGH